MKLVYRKATIDDLTDIILLLFDDKLGKNREEIDFESEKKYVEAFNKINNDSNQYLLVVCEKEKIVGTCHLTLIPSLTFKGSTRMQIEAVRVSSDVRGQGVGNKMINHAIDWGKKNEATIFQLTTNKERKEVIRFYERLGFKSTHEGMKLYLKYF